MTSDSPAPCQTCGQPARLRHQRVDGEVTEVRVCTSPRCPTNGPEKSIGDAV